MTSPFTLPDLAPRDTALLRRLRESRARKSRVPYQFINARKRDPEIPVAVEQMARTHPQFCLDMPCRLFPTGRGSLCIRCGVFVDAEEAA